MQVNLFKIEEVAKIASVLNENGYSNQGFDIVIPVPNIELLNKINEELYYKNNGKESGFDIERVDEINLNIYGISFKYVVCDDEQGRV